ncbi:MAG: tetratricopeptide repeat protein [Cyclobacteriaceae bacterium]
MKKLNLAIAVLAGTVFLSGCTLSKMIKLAADQDLQVNPNPLEVHGGEVPLEMSVVLPPKMLPTGKVYTINTIYKYGDKEVTVGSVEFKADEFPNSSSTTSRKSEEFTFPYQDGMNPGQLMIEGVASDPRNGKSKTSPRMSVAKGLVMTSSFAKPVAFTSYADHGYVEREELIPTNVDFFFEQGVSRLNPYFKVDGDNNRTKSNNLSAFIAEKNVTRTVTITGTHSPEGTETINSNLAEDRAKAIENFYRRQMRRYDYKGMADSIKFIIKPVIQDWASLKTALKSYQGIPSDQKSQITKIINGTGSFEDKAKAISNLSFYDKVLKEVYPGLRTAQTQILTVKPKKSNAEISVLAKQIVDGKAPADTLSASELLFSATLTPSLDEKVAIYKAASASGNWVAHNNLGATYLEQAMQASGSDAKDLIEMAVTQFEIAKKKNDKSPEVSANMAAAFMLQGDYAKAYDATVAAEGASPSNDVKGKVKAMKGSVQVIKGEYEAAKAAFTGAQKGDVVTFDYGLAALLNGDYEEAKGILSKVEGDEVGAEAAYLRAVTAARLNDTPAVIANLKSAVKQDPALKDKALNDLEFNKYADAVAQAVK